MFRFGANRGSVKKGVGSRSIAGDRNGARLAVWETRGPTGAGGGVPEGDRE